MSGGGGSGTNTTVTQSGPPAEFLQAYQNVVGQAQNVAAQPLQQYSGNTVAGLSPDQQAAIQQIQSAQGIADPFINAAAQEFGASTNDLTTGMAPYTAGAVGMFNQASQGLNFNQLTDADIQRYQNPYTQNVIDATQAQFNNQNAIQQQGIVGNAISNGAFGGDRSAVAQGITAGQQQLAQAPVIAGLRNQGYVQALQAAQQQQGAGLSAQQASQQLRLGAGQGMSGLSGQQLQAAEAQNQFAGQAGTGLANLGLLSQNTALTQAQAQLQAGTLEQQQAQSELNVPYQQFLQRQAYPFQTTGWLANIATGLGAGAGGTSSTTVPGPSTGSQIAGGLTTGIGLLGATGAFGSNGYLSNSFGSGSGGGGGGYLDSGGFDVARGGAIPRHADGGIIQPLDSGAIPIITGIPDLSMSYIPQGGMKGGHFNLNTSTGSTATTTGGGSQDSVLGSILKGAGTIAAGIYGGPGGAAAAGALSNAVHFERGGGITANDNWFPSEPQRRAAGGIMIPQLAGPMNGGVSYLPGGNGVPIPQLNRSFMRGSMTGGGGGIDAVNNYFAQNKASAAPGPMTAPSGAMVPPPPPPPAPVAAAPAVDPQAEIDQFNWFNNRESGNSNESGGGAARGGIIPFRRTARADGGELPDWAIYDNPQQPPAPDIGITAANTTDWRDEQPMAGGPDQGVPELSMPDTGTGSAPEAPPPMLHPAAAPVQAPVRPAAYTGGQGIMLPEPPMPEPPPQQAPMAPPQQMQTDQPQQAQRHGMPWETLIAAGLGIMGGSSPHAMVNIGRGGLQGLQFGEQVRQREETMALRQQQAAELAQYRRDMIGVRQTQAETGASRAATYAGAQQGRTAKDVAMTAYYQARAAAASNPRSSHMTGAELQNQTIQTLMGTVNPETGQNFTQPEAYANVRGLDVRRQNANTALAGSIAHTAQGYERLDQGAARIDDARQRAAEAQRHNLEGEGLRRQALAQASDQFEKRAIQTATTADLRTASSVIMAQPGIKYPQALEMVRKSRQSMGAERGGAGGDGVQEGQIVQQNGMRYIKRNGQFVPVE